MGNSAAPVHGAKSVLSNTIVLQIAVLLAVAVLTRMARIGDPTISGDEQFYLLVGDRIWHGALPFVDIWDRKPIGLFLIYALFRVFSPDGVLGYQLAALVFAAATAFVLTRIAMRVAGLLAAIIAGALYLLYLPIVGGAGGQSPVFYDLFTALAALLVVRCLEGREQADLWRNGLGAMLLVGLAIQVKYTALFEGIAFGLTLLWLAWRTSNKVAFLAGYASLLVAAALLPTVLALALYAIAGHAEAFFSANFVSIFLKSQPPGFSEVQTFLVVSAIKMAPIVVFAGVAVASLVVRRSITRTTGFAMLWAALTFVEFFAIGHYYDHYAIPLLMPLVILIASLLDSGLFAVVVPSLLVLFVAQFPNAFSWSSASDDRANIAALTAALTPFARQGCIYLNDGPPILYLTTRSCLPSAYVFPGHLADAEEAAATNATASMKVLLRTRPSAIVIADHPRVNPRNAVTDALLSKALAADYHLVKILSESRVRRQSIYARNDLR